jgi:hypothetical protein
LLIKYGQIVDCQPAKRPYSGLLAAFAAASGITGKRPPYHVENIVAWMEGKVS